MNISPRKLAACIAFSTCAAFAGTAEAAFTYATCSTNVFAPLTVPVLTGPREFERDTREPWRYSDNQNYTWTLRFNPNVGFFAPRLQNFSTEAGWDKLTIGMQSGQLVLQGEMADGYSAGSGFLSSGLVAFAWQTDDSVGRESTPTIDEVAVACNATAAPLQSYPLTANTRQEGVLIASKDVHYYRVTQKANARMWITLDVLRANTTSPDLDLYVSTNSNNQFPDSVHNDYRSAKGNTGGVILGIGYKGGEALYIPAPSSSRTLYIAVHSFAGAAHYSLHASNYQKTNPTNMTVCVEGGVSTTTPGWSDYEKNMRWLSARVAQMTNGNYWVDTWTAKKVSSCSDDKCSNHDCDAVMTPHWAERPCAADQSIRGDRFPVPYIGCASPDKSLLMSHEFSHAHLWLYDEYEGISWPGEAWNYDLGPFCGHTVMNGPSQSHTLCSSHTHCKDPQWSTKSARYYRPRAGNEFVCDPTRSGWSFLVADGYVYSDTAPVAGKSVDPWDSLRKNQYFLDQVAVLPAP